MQFINPQYLYLRTGYLDQNQVLSALTKARDHLVQLTGDQSLKKCKFEINVVTDTRGNGIASRKTSSIVRVSDQKVGYALLGHNLDGSERKEVIVEEKPEIEFVKPESGLWSDYPDDDVAVGEVKVLPPLVTVEPVNYTEEQIEVLTKNGINDLCVEIKVDHLKLYNFNSLPEPYLNEKTGKLEPHKFADKCHHVLRSMTIVPNGFTKEDFKTIFKAYSTDEESFKWFPSEAQKRLGLKSKWETYPIIEFRTLNFPGKVKAKGVVIIYNSTHHYDGQYASNMRCQSTIKGVHFIFSHMFKSEFTSSEKFTLFE